MLFNSTIFIFVFLPITLAVYALLGATKGEKKKNIWLVAASLLFYAYWNPNHIFILIGSIVCNYAIATATLQSQHKKRMWLAIGITLNVSLLFFFKYFDFAMTNVALATDTALTPMLHLALPLGISFFTFQQIAYQVDTYHGESGHNSLLDYTLFVSFFPQLIAGPIVHHKEMMPQFRHRVHSRDWNDYAAGIILFTLGLFKKIVIADSLAPWTDAGYAAAGELSLINAWCVTLCYTFQIYFDFSGYTDMALGAAKLFNISLPVNFRSPYKATSIQDFWNRWHITLSRWLKNYIYIPLGGNRAHNARTYLNILIVFLVSGVWHGAGWTFIVWGLLHGAAFACHRLWKSTRIQLNDVLSLFLTFMFVHIAWIFFRADSIQDALHLCKALYGGNGIESFGKISVLCDYLGFDSLLNNHYTMVINIYHAAFMIFAASVIAFIMPNSADFTNKMLTITRESLSKSKLIVISGTTILLFWASIYCMIIRDTSVFLYFNF
jgi:D-alanyl-lipoteichoic acid acyltransferase DltB (MBOAT superfamily)